MVSQLVCPMNPVLGQQIVITLSCQDSFWLYLQKQSEDEAQDRLYGNMFFLKCVLHEASHSLSAGDNSKNKAYGCFVTGNKDSVAMKHVQFHTVLISWPWLYTRLSKQSFEGSLVFRSVLSVWEKWEKTAKLFSAVCRPTPATKS